MASTSSVSGVALPLKRYSDSIDLWKHIRAACAGERAVKACDAGYIPGHSTTLLLPFSPSMTLDQFSFLLSEAEWPGITSMYARILAGGLLRKDPQLEIPDGFPEEAIDWLTHNFAQDGGSLVSFLDAAIWEELQTSRAWIFVDFPVVDSAADLTKEEMQAYKPYPVLWKAESIINWRVEVTPLGQSRLSMVIVQGTECVDNPDDEFHSLVLPTIWVHELVDNKYQVRKFQGKSENATAMELVNTNTSVVANGVPLDFIPAWPLNGSIDIVDPMLAQFADKEFKLYNKMSRRNHLLYGAATYTPVIFTEMSDEVFEEVVGAGLGSWLKLGQADKADILKTPTDALADMEKAIASSIDELAKLGIRMLAPEAAQSGVALELRNAAQTAQLGTLNVKASNTIAAVIAFMLSWRYDIPVRQEEIIFNLSEDFNPVPIGADWLRLATEWYENGHIPRSTWLSILKANDIVPPDYNDVEGQKEINSSDVIPQGKDEKKPLPGKKAAITKDNLEQQ